MQRKYFTPQRETENSNTNKGLHIISRALTVNLEVGTDICIEIYICNR